MSVWRPWPFTQPTIAALKCRPQFVEHEPAKVFHDLAGTPDVDKVVKRKGSDLHRKNPAERPGSLFFWIKSRPNRLGSIFRDNRRRRE